MSLIDSGPDRVELYAEVESFDALGNPRRVPEETPTVLWVALHPLKVSEWNQLGSAEYGVYGQQVNSMLEFITRADVRAGAWALVRARGREWDVVGEPVQGPRTGVTRVVLRARNPEPAYG